MASPVKPEVTAANKQRFMDALEANIGLVLRASRATKIPSMTHYHWMDNDPVYRERVEKLIELKRDFVENKLQELVKKGVDSCVTFASKSLLRKRGYDTATVIKNEDGEKFQVDVDAATLGRLLAQVYKKADEPT